MEVQERNKLRDYQKEDVQFILKKKHVGLFNEMRTGKTATALSAAEQIQGRVLIICPCCILPVWKTEINKWCTEKDRYTLINYEQIRTKPKLVDEFIKQKFDMIIIDEAHKIKNRKSKTRLAVNRLHAEYQVALTGTPSTNEPWDIWAILNWLKPYVYRSYWDFIDTYFKCTSNYFSSKIPVDYLPGAKAALANALSEFCTNRKMKDVLDWNTTVENLDVFLEPSKTQLKAVNTLMDEFEYENINTQIVIEKLARIRQLCIDPCIILTKKVPSAKTKWLKDFLKSYKDSSIVILSTSTKYINTVLSDLVDACIVGETKQQQRKQIVDDFQNEKIKTLAMNFQIAKEGWTLDTADYLIIMDIYPPSSDYIQACKRIVATIPEKVKPKEVIRVRLQGTYDSELYDLIDNNCSITDVINNFANYKRR